MSNERPLDDYFRRAADPNAPGMEMNLGPAIPVSQLQAHLPAEVLGEREIANHCRRLMALVAEHGEGHPDVARLRERIRRLREARESGEQPGGSVFAKRESASRVSLFGSAGSARLGEVLARSEEEGGTP